MQSSRPQRRATLWAEAMRVKRVDRRLVLPRTAKAQSNAREETATNVPSAEKASLSLVRTLNDRSATGRSRGVELWAEDESVFRQQLEYLDLGAVPPAISTISLDFSSDGKLFASTHGDHTVKITSFLQGKVVQTLRGHPRTPWTVKFHPKNSRIVASGCIGYEVKVWNVSTGQCLHTATLEAAIISLSFHPSGRMIAMASSLYVYLWDYNNKARPYIAWAHSHTLRCVRFTPDSNGIIVGAANSSSSAPPPRTQTQVSQNRNQNQNQNQNKRRTLAARGGAEGGDSGAGSGAGAATPAPAPSAARGGAREAGGGAGAAAPAQAPAAAGGEAGGAGGAAPPAPAPPQLAEVTFRLQIWDFSLEAALEENIAAAMTRERVLLNQTLLYNDGGFDVSQDGLWLCAIAGLREKAEENRPPPTGADRGADAVVGTLPSPAVAATVMPTVMEVEEADGEEEELPAAAARARTAGDGSGFDNPGGACRGAGEGRGRRDSTGDPLIAPQNGSHLGGLGKRTPLVVKTAAPGRATVVGAPPVAPEGAKEGSGGGSGRCLQGATGGREERKHEERERERGRLSVLPPWPSRARPRPYFSVALAGEDLGKAGEAAEKGGGALADRNHGAPEGSAAAGVAGRSADARNEPPPFTPPPFTPSPRITLKRRLSGSWLSAVSSGRSSGGGGGVGSSGGFWGRELRRGGSPRLGGSERGGGGGSGGGGGGGGGATQRNEDRPPPLPPPPPLPGAPSSSTAAPSSSSVAHPPRPPARPSPPLRACSERSPAPSSGGLRISLPLLLPPPPPPPSRQSADSLDIGASAVVVSAGELKQGEQERRRQGEQDPRQPQQQQQDEGAASPPPQPLFFLQVPRTGGASGATTGVAQAASEGQGWGTQYLSAGTAGENTVQQAPVTYGRKFPAGGRSTGEAGHGHGGRVDGDRQAGAPDDATARGGEGRGGGSEVVDSTSWEESRSGSSGAPTSFGRAHRRALPTAPAPLPAGKFVPHLVMVSLNLEGARGAGAGGGGGEKVARVVRAEAMDIFTAKQVTSVKLSPSARYILLGVGVRGDGGQAAGGQAPRQAVTPSQADAPGPTAPSQHRFPLSSIYRSADLQPVNSMPTAEEDVNIACFHPEPGMGCVYGTKQGRVGLVRMAH